jgi:hypothetical protein
MLKSSGLISDGINQAFSFVSVGVKIDERITNASGPFCFRIHGELSHRIGSLCPGTGEGQEQAPQAFAQIYIHSGDSEEAVERRLQVSNLDGTYRNLFTRLQSMMHDINPFVCVFKQAHQIIAEKPARERLDVFAALQLDREADRRRYNLPIVDEVAAIIPQNAEEGYSKDLILRYQHGRLMRLSDTSPTYQCLAYPMLFPRGELGWHPNLKKSALFFHNLDEGDITNVSDGPDANDEEDPQVEDSETSRGKQTTVSRAQFYKYNLFPRQGKPNAQFHSGKLYHQYTVDGWAVTEQNRLDWLRFNQSTLRADVYKGVKDAIHASDRSLNDIGKRFILPATHAGSTRHMFQLFQDSMAICRYFGHADLFITMTANPSWKEIKDELYPGQTHSDRPDLVARVFQMKKKALLKRIKNDGIFGDHVASVHTIEFQKRGLPHVHLIVFLKNDHKIRQPEDIANMIRADIPDPVTEPRLYQLVTSHMMHSCSKKRCLDERNKCNKNFPKPFWETTTMTENGYAQMARPDNGRKIERMVDGVSKELTNQHVVPYCPYLLLEFECHINVECLHSMKSFKYIHKYIYKGDYFFNVLSLSRH